VSKGKTSARHFDKGADRSSPTGSASGGFRDAVDLETACHGINRINDRIRRDKNATDEERMRSKVTLSRSFDAWLNKKVPE
jgi:hypothetical protein